MILDLIDYNVEDEFDEDEETGEITIYGAPTSFSEIQKHLEAEGFEVTGAEFTYIPNDLKDVIAEERELSTRWLRSWRSLTMFRLFTPT